MNRHICTTLWSIITSVLVVGPNTQTQQVLAQEMTNRTPVAIGSMAIPGQDSDYDGLPDTEDLFPLIASYAVVKWEVNSVSLDFDVKSSQRVTGTTEAGRTSTETSRGSFSWVLGADGRIETGLRASGKLSANPLELFGLRKTAIEGTGSLGLGAHAQVHKARETQKSEQSDMKTFLSISDETAVGNLHFTFSVNVRNYSPKKLILTLAPLPILIGDRVVAEALPSTLGPSLVVTIPADRSEGVLVSFRADLNDTKAMEIVDYIRGGNSPTIDLARSRITIHAQDDTAETDLISKVTRIEANDCLLTVRCSGGSTSWRIAPTFSFKPVTVRQAMEAVNQLVRKQARTEADFFKFDGNVITDVANSQGAGLWVAQTGNNVKSLDEPFLKSPLPSQLQVVLVERESIAEQARIAAKDFFTRTNAKLSSLEKMEPQVPYWIIAAEKHWPEGSFLLALCHRDGVGVIRDLDKMRDRLGEAVALGYAPAQYWLACAWGKDYAEAVKWFRKAAEQGLEGAQNSLGCCYFEGAGLTQDYAEAVTWYRKAAEQNLARAQFNLGICYQHGYGVAKDEVEAAKWYRKAAEQGNAEAEAVLGTCYYKGDGVSVDYREAVKWARKAAEQENARGQLILGACFEGGFGMAQDYGEAVKWLRKAAERGDDETVRQAAKDSVEKILRDHPSLR